jgi:hypothetical protein
MTTPTTVNARFQLRADTAANWAAVNPTLLTNELGLETDTQKLKLGNGSTAWNSLGYFPSIVSGGTVLGNLEIGTTGTLTFEGSTADGFETTLAVADPTADRTITLPNQSGTVVVSGNASIVDADIAANAEIAVSKLANGTANQVIVTDGTNVSWSDDLTLAGNLTVNGTTTTINTQDLLVEDKNIVIGNVDTPSDVTADGGGITLKGTTDKTINWVDATDAWTSSERFSVPLGSHSAPSLTFTGDPNTGIYSPGADQLAISANGVQRVNFNGSTEVVFNDGGADVDFRIEGDTNPDLFKIDAGTDQVQVANLNGGPLAGTRNRIINGDMRIDQRNAGASVTPTAAGYTLDRWFTGLTQASKYSVQRNAGSVTPPTGFTNYLGVTSLSAYSVLAGDTFNIQQRVEGFNVADLGWGTASAQTVTLSFWVRSSITGIHSGSLWNNAFNRAYPFTFTVSAANTWEQKTVTIVGDTSGTWTTDNTVGIGLSFNLGSGSSFLGTAGSWGSTGVNGATGSVSVVGTNGATFYITGVQLEPGTVATPFERRSYGQELALCQRYYWKSQGGYFYFGGYQVSTGDMTFVVPLPVTMRADPTVTRSGGWSTTNVTEQTAKISASHFIVVLRTAAAGVGYLTAQSDGIYTASIEL